MATKPPSVSKKTKPLTLPKPGGSKKTHVAKQFKVAAWTGTGQGEKIVAYGSSGIGKTTLASMAPNPIFIGLDDGGRKIVNPLTGEPIQVVEGIESFQDVRDALAQDNLWPDGCTIVIDTATKLDEPIQTYIMDNITVNGQRVKSFRKYGWDGDRHLLDTWRTLLTDLDRHIRKGRNVLLLCQQGQIRIANAEGADYLEDGPFLPHRNDCSVREEVKQWADHVLRVGYLDLEVQPSADGKKAGKVVSTDATRAIFCGGAKHYTAKSRPIGGNRIPEVISFESEADNSVWQYIFENAGQES